MRVVRRDPDKGYVDCMFWVPKKYIPVEATKAALTFSTMTDRVQRFLTLWQETEHHLLIPREFWDPASQPFPVVDCRPTQYPKTRVSSRIQLDLKSNFKETTQRDAVAAMQKARGGILQLACVSGDTVLNINRAKVEKKITIAQLYKKLHESTRVDHSIPTYIRAKKEEGIGLHLVEDVIYRGKRQTYEIRTADGKKLRLTRDHQVLTPTGFRSIDEGLSVGSEVLVDSKDGNPKNNNIDNLEVLPRADHGRAHGNAKYFRFGEVQVTRITSIRAHGIEDVYDVVCADPHHNFVANGIVVHNCGKGKSVCALELIAREGVPALIIVDNTQLLEQWTKEIHRHLDVPGGVGTVASGKFDWKKDIVVATYHTIANIADDMPEEMRRHFGLVIWDEAHHMAAPTWMKSADLFPCKRIGLTATPERIDGMHVVYDFHLGPVLYKDLVQELKPQIFFTWTGLEVDTTDPKVRAQVCDVNGELHTSMLSSYFGQWRTRLDFILNEVRLAAQAGRKILVLSYSVAELVNMYAIWNNDPELYTDIPDPTPQDVGETLQPQQLDERTMRRLHKKLGELNGILANPALPSDQKRRAQMHKNDILERLKRHEVWKKIENEREKRQRSYVKDRLEMHANGSAGLMIGKIKPKERARMLAEKQVTFAIMKYGREGLDEQSLDTVFVCEPMSQKNALQQLMGRVLRIKAGKKQPIVMFFEDNIGPMIGMCTNLRRHLRSWPLEEGGPFEYTLVGHPRKGQGRPTWGVATTAT